MPLRVAIELVDPRQPDRAVRSALRGAFAGLAPARPLHILELGWNAGPGTEIAPWTRSGIEAAARAANLEPRREVIELGDAGPHSSSSVRTQLPGARRARALPSAWFGRHLCLVIPCAALDPGSSTSSGPLTAALRGLDRHIGGPRKRESPRVAARMLATVFSSITVIVDGAWWADLSEDARAARRLFPLNRVLAVHTDHPDPAWSRTLMQTFDPWLAHRLGLSLRGAGLDHAIRTAGDGGRQRWPRVPSEKTPPGRGLASRALEALWKPQGPSGRPRLGPSVPGDLARVWSSWPSVGGPR